MFRAIIVLLLLVFATTIDGFDRAAHALKDESSMTMVEVEYAKGTNRQTEFVVDFGYETDGGAVWVLVLPGGNVDEVPASEATLVYGMTTITPSNWKNMRKLLKEAQASIKK